VRFQNNINAIHKWLVDWKMPFNKGKCQIKALGNQNYRPLYRLGEIEMDWVDTTIYLEVVMQSNLKLDHHITLEKDKASKILGAIKHVLCEAPREGKLLSYTSLLYPIHAGTVWDPTSAKEIESLEMLQHRVVRFIAGIKERESVNENALSLEA